MWGAVDTISYKGRDYSVFGAGGPQKLNLPGDVTADVDSKGRLVEIQRPGLSLKTMNYTDDDQLDQVLFDGQVLRDHDYQNGDLTQIRVFNPAGTEDFYTYGYDDYGRLSEILANDQVLAAWTYPDLSQPDPDPDKNWGHSDRVLSYTDGNGVVYDYSYDRYGHINGIELSGGPVFQMRYDATGRPLEIQSSGMRVLYDGWEQGLPKHITWGDGTHFTVDRDSNDNLTRIASDNETFVLDLTWQETPPGSDPCEGTSNPPPKRLTRILRQAAGFSETLEPTYNDDEHLTGVRINRNDNGNQDIIEEGYGQVEKQLLAGLTRVLNGSVLVDETYQRDEGADNRRITQRVGQAGAATPAGTDQYQYDPTLGNLTQITTRAGNIRTFVWDGFRRLREIRDNGSLTASYQYDHNYRRIRAATSVNPLPLAFAYQNSRVIAIGLYEGPGQVQWTHAIGQGPLGPAFIKDLTGAGHDYYIFCDHLGTPLAYKNAHSGTIYLNPQSPWGESLANAPTRGSPYTNQNFALPPDAVFPTVPLGLSGHLGDADTGLIYMHHRYYDPQLGHFLNPDFRAPDIYDPSTFTEPYAYAAGNPMMFWDPDGLAVIIWKGNKADQVKIEEGDDLEKIWETLSNLGLVMMREDFDNEVSRLNLDIDMNELQAGQIINTPTLYKSDVFAASSIEPQTRHMMARDKFFEHELKGVQFTQDSLKGLLTGRESEEWIDPLKRRVWYNLGTRQYACVDLASDTLEEGFKRLGDDYLSNLFKNRPMGLQIQKDLVDIGWEAFYLAPSKDAGKIINEETPRFLRQPYRDLNFLNSILINPSRPYPSYQAMDHEQCPIRIPVNGALYDYAKNVKGQINHEALDFLQNTRFAVGTWAGGSHVWLLVYGKVYEVHYQKSFRDEDLFELRPIEDVTWTHGLIVVPPSY